MLSIENRQANVSDILKKLQQLKGRVIIQWIPVHSNIPGNELADKYAKEIAQNGEAGISPLSFNTARAIIKREIKDPPPKHPIVSKAYEHLSIIEEKKIKTRKEAALLAQLRSGHCKELRAYQHRIDESKDETCPRCQLEAEDVQHWLACPATIMKRQSIFGDDDVPLGMMTQQPTGTHPGVREGDTSMLTLTPQLQLNNNNNSNGQGGKTRYTTTLITVPL